METIEFALKADNLAVHEGAGGGVEARDGNGQIVFRSPAAQMWNSAGDATPAAVASAENAKPSQGPSVQSLSVAEADGQPTPVPGGDDGGGRSAGRPRRG